MDISLLASLTDWAAQFLLYLSNVRYFQLLQSSDIGRIKRQTGWVLSDGSECGVGLRKVYPCIPCSLLAYSHHGHNITTCKSMEAGQSLTTLQSQHF